MISINCQHNSDIWSCLFASFKELKFVFSVKWTLIHCQMTAGTYFHSSSRHTYLKLTPFSFNAWLAKIRTQTCFWNCSESFNFMSLLPHHRKTLVEALMLLNWKKTPQLGRKYVRANKYLVSLWGLPWYPTEDSFPLACFALSVQNNVNLAGPLKSQGT